MLHNKWKINNGINEYEIFSLEETENRNMSNQVVEQYLSWLVKGSEYLYI